MSATIHKKRTILTVLIALAVCYASRTIAANVSLTPARASNFYSGTVTLQITGLATGETVRVERFIDFNTNDVVNSAVDLMVQSFSITDNQSSVIGGVTNANVFYDSNPTNGVITTTLNFHDVDIDHAAGRFIFRVSSPTGRFSSSNGLFRITNSILGQTARGTVRNSGTNVGYAIVAALTDRMRLVTSAIVGSNGQYNISAPTGTYSIIAAKRGYVCNFDTAPVVTLTSGANPSNNIPLLAANRSISGRLVDAANTNIGLAGVNLFVNSNSFFALAFTDTNGAFNVPVTSGIWKLEPDQDALRLLGYLGLRNTPMADTSTGSVTGLVIPVPRATVLLYGTVKNETNSPLSGIEIFAESSDRVFSTRAISDSAGYYSIGILAGDWDANADTESLAAMGYVAESSPRFSIAAGQALQRNFVAARFTAFLAGRVIDESGAAVADMGIRANDDQGRYSSANTGTNGTFAMGVLDGTWSLRLDYNEDVPQKFVYPEISVTVSNGVSVSNIVYQVLRATNTVSGTLQDYYGNPVSGLSVYAFAVINGQQYSPSGNYTIGNANYSLMLSAGTWQIGIECYSAMDVGYNCPPLKTIVLPGGGSTLDFRLLSFPGVTTLDSVSRLQNGQLHFRINGTIGYDYQIESSTDLFSWTPLWTTNSAAPPFDFIDSANPSNQVRRFYRAGRLTPSD